MVTNHLIKYGESASLHKDASRNELIREVGESILITGRLTVPPSVSNKWTKKKSTSLSSSLLLSLFGALWQLYRDTQWFCCVSVVSCGHSHFLRRFRLYGKLFETDYFLKPTIFEIVSVWMWPKRDCHHHHHFWLLFR